MSSSSKNKVKPRLAHCVSYGSLDLTYYLDKCGNSGAKNYLPRSIDL